MEKTLKLFSDFEDLYMQMISPVLEKYHCTSMEFHVLMFLANNPKYNTASEIVKIRHLTKSHVSMSLRSLQEKGWVQGTISSTNRKTRVLKVLKQAEPIVEEGRQAQKRFGQILFEGFTDTELETLKTLITRIDENIVHYHL